MFINIQHSTFNIQRPGEHPTPNIEHPRMILGCRSMLTSSFMVPTRVENDVEAFHEPGRSFVSGGARVPASRSFVGLYNVRLAGTLAPPHYPIPASWYPTRVANAWALSR